MNKFQEEATRSIVKVEKDEIRHYLDSIQDMFKELAWGAGDIWIKLEFDESVLRQVKWEVRHCYQQLNNLNHDVRERIWQLRQNASKREAQEVKSWEDAQR